MFYKIHVWIKDGRNRLWVKPALGSIFAIAFALFATLTDTFVSADKLPSIKEETINTVLNAIPTSMLAVTTFSLSIMVASLASVASGASPRATELVMADDNTQNAISAFISAFIFSVIAQIALGMGYYGRGGRFVLFVATVLMLLYLIYTLIVWVKTLSTLGRMSNTLGKLEDAATEAMLDYRRAPRMGAGLGPPAPVGGALVLADRVGYVRHIDMRALQRHAAEAGLRLHISMRPGMQVYPDSVLVRSEGADQPNHDAIRDAFLIGKARTYRQDPRHGIVILSEVAQRALSPAVNDPGTAIAVMNTITRILIDARPTNGDAREEPPDYDRLTMIELDEGDFVTQGFDSIARDGAANFDVQMRMQKLLAAIGRGGSVTLGPAARQQAARALQRIEVTDMLEQEKNALREAFQTLHGGLGMRAVG